MIAKEIYEREIVRMWDSLRDDRFKGCDDCVGVICKVCPIYDAEYDNCHLYNDVYNAVERWTSNHPLKKFKVSRLEYDILKHLSDNTALMYITRNVYGNVYLFNEEPRKSSGNWYGNGARSLSVLDELFQFVKSEDEEPTSIKDVLDNCEVEYDR